MFFIIHKTIAKLDIMHHTSILTQFVTQTRENKLSFRGKKNYRKIKIPTPSLFYCWQPQTRFKVLVLIREQKQGYDMVWNIRKETL